MSKHTPGHWEVEKDDKTVVSTSDYNIAFVVTLPSKEETTANARLISAAPDMAEALKRLCHYANDVREDGEPPSHEDWRNAWEAARAALKKAGIQ